MNPERAREAYIKLSNIGMHVGPFVFYNKVDWSEVENIYEEIGQANKYITRVGDHVFEVASPWHAYFFVQSLSQNLAKNTYTKFLYRGQSSPEKPLPTLYRKGVNRKSAKATFERFKFYVDYYGLTNKELYAEQNLVLMARHHGLATPHLDFTVDPSVALFFAGSGENLDGYSRIFFTSLNAIFPWAKLYFPPVFAQRLYAQRGILLDLLEVDYPAFNAQLSELRFPREHSFVVYRNGKEITMFPDNALNSLFEFLVTSSISDQDFAETGLIKATYAEKLNKLMIVKPGSMATILLNTFEEKNMEKIFKGCLEDLDWMLAALTPSRIWLSDQELEMDIDKEVVKALCRDNSYTYKKLLEEADEYLKAARRQGGWMEKLQQKFFNEFLEALKGHDGSAAG